MYKLSHNKFGVQYNFAVCNSQWFIDNFHIWEDETFRTFQEHKNQNKVAIDIGGWIGATCIWLSKNFREVIVVEANKYCIEALRANCKASNCENITIVDKPIYHEHTEVIFGQNKARPGAIDCSMFQIRDKPERDSYKTPTIVLEDLFQYVKREDVGFVKVDIEGSEEYILADLFTYCSQYKIPLNISFHIDWWNNTDFKRFTPLFEMANIVKNDTTIVDPIEALTKHNFSSLTFIFK